MKNIILLIISTISISCNAQIIENNSHLIEKAQKDIKKPLEKFFSECLLTNDYSNCVNELIISGTDEYKTYLIGGALYNIDSDRSFELHKKSFDKNPNELNFNLEYAMELHRKGNYKEAIPLYLKYKEEKETDYRIDVWLSECFINIGKINKSIKHWNGTNHPSNHTGIDKAIHAIHGRTDQIKLRSKLRNEVNSKNIKSSYELIFLDLNWELDWWNTNIQDVFIENDIELIKKVFGEKSEVYQDLITYNSIKHLSKESNNDSIKNTLINSKIIINGNRLLPNGKITSDILRILLMNNIVNETDFYNQRKSDFLKLENTQKDAELLNIYAYLESVVNGHISTETDKKGWHEYKDERFAISYFLGLAEKNKYDNPDLSKALFDFPNSAKIQWVKLNCAVIENKEFKSDLIELIKKDFKTLGSDQNKYSYGLKSYFYLLENGK
tara:strand:- start:268 stop:1590 length:1323 start_codon:yes stop_codon:yes gene_type:complete